LEKTTTDDLGEKSTLYIFWAQLATV